MGGATAGGQLIVLVALPFLTRLYAPYEFGAAASFAGIVGLLVVIAGCRYELAIPLPCRDGAAIPVVVLSLMIVTLGASMAALAWLPVSQWFDIDIGLGNEAAALLIGIAVFASGVYQTLSYWLVRRAKFRAIAITRIQQGLTGNGTQVILGCAGFGVLGLILGQLIGQCAGLTRLAAEFRTDRRWNKRRVRFRDLRWAARRYRRFPLYETVSGLLSVGGAQIPILLFAALISPTLAGHYALAYRVLSAPIGLVGKAISSPLLTQLVETRRRGSPAALMDRLIRGLALLSLPSFALIAATAKEFVPLIFGPRWADASTVVAWTAVWVGWQFIASTISVALIATEGQKLNTMLQLTLNALRIAAIIAGAAIGSAKGALVGFSLASIVGYIVYTAATAKAIGLPLPDTFRALFHPMILSVFCLATAIAVPASMAGLKYAAIGCVIVYWIFLCCLRHGGLLSAPSLNARDK